MSDMDWQPADETQDLRPHLPECYITTAPDDDEAGCICKPLRACEARVTERHNAEHEDDRLAAFQNGYDAATVKERQRSALLIADAYGKGLSAARDAVAALLGKTVPPSDGVTEALAAIDALKGEQA